MNTSPKIDVENLKYYVKNIRKVHTQDIEKNKKGIEDILSKMFNKNISLHIIRKDEVVPYKDIMIVFSPEMQNSFDKLVLNFFKTSEDSNQIIDSTWASYTNWIIEIDSSLFSHSYEIDEIVALLIHQTGHIIMNGNQVIKNAREKFFEEQKPMDFAIMSKDKFRKIGTGFLLNLLKFDKNCPGIFIKADTFIQEIGLLNSLLFMINKLKEEPQSKTITGSDMMNDIKIATTDPQYYKIELEGRLMDLPVDGVLKEQTESIIESFFSNEYRPLVLECVCGDIKKEAQTVIDTFYAREFFDIGKKKVKTIHQNQIDYIRMRAQDIQSIDDKIMVLSYVNSKIEMIDFYLGIYENPKLKKKYSMTNSYSQLKSFKQQLMDIRDSVIRYKIKEKKELVVWYPSGYEG